MKPDALFFYNGGEGEIRTPGPLRDNRFRVCSTFISHDFPYFPNKSINTY